MKITIDELLKCNPCSKGFVLYIKLKLQDIDFNNIKEIEVYKESNFYYLNWLCERFNLTLTILYKENKSVYESGKMIHFRNNGFDEFWEYNEFGVLIYYNNVSGNYKRKFKYNNSGFLIYYEDSKGFKEDLTYDENNNLTYYKNSNGIIQDYTSEGMIHIKNSKKYEQIEESKETITYGYDDIYNEFGLLAYREDSDGFKYQFIYNENNELIDVIPNYEFTEDELKYEIKL